MARDPERYTPRTTTPTARDTGATLRMVGILVVVGALGLFFLQNLQSVELHFLWFDWDTRLIWALIASAAVGAIGMFLTTALLGRRRRTTTTTRER